MNAMASACGITQECRVHTAGPHLHFVDVHFGFAHFGQPTVDRGGQLPHIGQLLLIQRLVAGNEGQV